MSVEGDPTSGTFYIDDLNATYPAGDESKSQGDDHLRLIKKALLNTFPSVTAPVTASHTELNYVDITTLGTQQASKALTADANNTVTVPSGGEINFASGSALQINGVAVTADAAELNKLDGVTVTTAEINSLASIGATTVATQLAAKAATAGPTFTGTVTLPSTTSIGTVSSTEIGYLDGCTEAIQSRLTGLKSFDIVFTLDNVSDGTYNVVLNTSFAFVVNSAYYDCGAGSVTAQIRDDGSSITSLGALSITTTDGNTSSGATVASGSKIDIVLTSASSCTGLVIQLKCTRS